MQGKGHCGVNFGETALQCWAGKMPSRGQKSGTLNLSVVGLHKYGSAGKLQLTKAKLSRWDVNGEWHVACLDNHVINVMIACSGLQPSMGRGRSVLTGKRVEKKSFMTIDSAKVFTFEYC
jgi:hypothetical protein